MKMQLLQISIIIFLITALKLSSENIKSLQGQAKIDSLLKELPKMKEDTNAVNLLKSLSFEYSRINPDEGIKYGEQGLKLAKQIKWKKGEAKCNFSIGFVYSYGYFNFSKGIENFFNALKIFKELNDNYSIIQTLNTLGNVYINLSDLSNSLLYSQRSLRISEKLNYKKGIAKSLINIGIIYRNQSDHKKALKSFNRSLIIFKELGDKNNIA